MKPLDLLIQRHLEQSDFHLGVLFAAARQQCRQARRRDAIGQGNTQLAAKAVGGGLDTIAGLLQHCKDSLNVLQKQPSSAGQLCAASGADKQACAEFFLQLLDGAR